MKRFISFGILFLVCAVLFAQESSPAAQAELEADETPEAVEVPQSILNNQYYLQSVRLTEQARESFEVGNYDASAAYSEQAAEYARRSDQYVSMRLAENVLAKAHSRYTWAGSVGAARRYPREYETASAAYNEAQDARKAQNWDETSAAANRVIIALAGVKAPDGGDGPSAGPQPQPPRGTLPAQYTVRQWTATGDCFSTIAGWPWVYGDVYQWRKLYDANKSKLPNPDNPHLIIPGMVLDIPSREGETRSGMWDPAARYEE
ncbi:MAG: LysM peptidoglycan-binding domain-containing protein [Spirochaetaceae bacterium]|jgi:nucleoid-associated protein YgaU|nr:LysM peptidoglycan-binding domain-containing protein [Spirochaetaceae bacterium]